MLYLVGIGLNDEKDITLKGLEIVKKCDMVYLENYTSVLNAPVKELEKVYKKKIIMADREMVEKGEEIIKNAKTKKVAFLVIGDVLGATTHADLMLRARKEKIRVEVVHNASILTAVGITGLSLYKFGKTTSIPFENYIIETPYNVLAENRNMHTLFLLDLKPGEKKYMKVSEAIEYLLRVEERKKKKAFTKETLCIGCGNLGGKNEIKAGKAKDLIKEKFRCYPQCLIVPGEMHFMEEEILNIFHL